jgi:hypothetical protein
MISQTGVMVLEISILTTKATWFGWGDRKAFSFIVFENDGGDGGVIQQTQYNLSTVC